MRKLLLSSLTLLTTFTYAQTTAEDWTQTDCDGIEHTLFDELNAGYCVIMEFAMATGCVPCITAAENIEPLVEEYNELYENRVRYYTFDYGDAMTCSGMQAWADEYSLSPTALFDNGTSILAYYGAMGMPTIVIVGGDDYAVHYEKMGFSVSHMGDISDAILAALGIEDTSGTDIINASTGDFEIYPNPSKEMVYISGNIIPDDIIITDINGKVIDYPGYTTLSINGTSTYAFDVTNLSSGVYFIQINEKGNAYIEKLMISR